MRLLQSLPALALSSLASLSLCGGTFSSSVCSATSCQSETRELALTVKVD